MAKPAVHNFREAPLIHPNISLTDPDWMDRNTYNPAWNGRIEAALPLIRGYCIADIGCGAPQHLRTILPVGVEYLPVDLTVWTTDTEECDLAAGRFPDRALAKCDTAVLLGVLEYMTDVPAVIRGLAMAPALVLSYRLGASGNASGFTVGDMRVALHSMGFQITSRVTYRDNLIIRAVRGWRGWAECLDGFRTRR